MGKVLSTWTTRRWNGVSHLRTGQVQIGFTHQHRLEDHPHLSQISLLTVYLLSPKWACRWWNRFSSFTGAPRIPAFLESPPRYIKFLGHSRSITALFLYQVEQSSKFFATVESFKSCTTSSQSNTLIPLHRAKTVCLYHHITFALLIGWKVNTSWSPDAALRSVGTETQQNSRMH